MCLLHFWRRLAIRRHERVLYGEGQVGGDAHHHAHLLALASVEVGIVTVGFPIPAAFATAAAALGLRVEHDHVVRLRVLVQIESRRPRDALVPLRLRASVVVDVQLALARRRLAAVRDVCHQPLHHCRRKLGRPRGPVVPLVDPVELRARSGAWLHVHAIRGAHKLTAKIILAVVGLTALEIAEAAVRAHAAHARAMVDAPYVPRCRIEISVELVLVDVGLQLLLNIDHHLRVDHRIATAAEEDDRRPLEIFGVVNLAFGGALLEVLIGIPNRHAGAVHARVVWPGKRSTAIGGTSRDRSAVHERGEGHEMLDCCAATC